MGLLSWFTGDNKNVSSIIDGVKSGLDYAVYTDQEKSEADQRVLDFTLKYLEATKNQSLARRVIAFIIVGVWAILLILAVTSKLFSEDYSKFIFEVLANVVKDPFSIVIGFYFATQMLSGLFSKK